MLRFSQYRRKDMRQIKSDRRCCTNCYYSYIPNPCLRLRNMRCRGDSLDVGLAVSKHGICRGWKYIDRGEIESRAKCGNWDQYYEMRPRRFAETMLPDEYDSLEE